MNKIITMKRSVWESNSALPRVRVSSFSYHTNEDLSQLSAYWELFIHASSTA